MGAGTGAKRGDGWGKVLDAKLRGSGQRGWRRNKQAAQEKGLAACALAAGRGRRGSGGQQSSTAPHHTTTPGKEKSEFVERERRSD